jgi:hypothetical protein
MDSGIAATGDAASLDATQDTAATPDTSVPTADAHVTLPEAAPPDTCANGTLTGDTFLPGAIYFLGQIQSSPSKPIGVAHWSDPGTFCLGMPANFANWAQIRPTDGRLLYMNAYPGGAQGFDNTVREFHADGCVTPTTTTAAPANPLANDPVVPTPMCDTEGGITTGTGNFRISPEGDVYYECNTSTGFPGIGWYGPNGQVLRDVGTELKRIGRGKIAYVSPTPDPTTGRTDPYIADLTAPLTSPKSIPVTPASPFNYGLFMGGRALDAGGFLIVIEPQGTGVAESADLWQVNPDGTASKVGSYPIVPDVPFSALLLQPDDGWLDGCNGLLQMADINTTPGFDYAIVRRTLPGESSFVYGSPSGEIVMPTGYLVGVP